MEEFHRDRCSIASAIACSTVNAIAKGSDTTPVIPGLNALEAERVPTEGKLREADAAATIAPCILGLLSSTAATSSSSPRSQLQSGRAMPPAT